MLSFTQYHLPHSKERYYKQDVWTYFVSCVVGPELPADRFTPHHVSPRTGWITINRMTCNDCQRTYKSLIRLSLWIFFIVFVCYKYRKVMKQIIQWAWQQTTAVYHSWCRAELTLKYTTYYLIILTIFFLFLLIFQKTPK